MANTPRWWEAFTFRSQMLRHGPQEVLGLRGGRGGAYLLGQAGEAPSASSRIMTDTEWGATGTQIYGGRILGEEYNDKLQGQKAYVEYDRMRKSDAQVRATLQVIKLPIRAATWKARPPENGDMQDQAIADFVNSKIFDDDAMETPWDDVLRNTLLQLDFGVSLAEIIWTVAEDGTYCFRRLAPRLPRTIWEWRKDPTTGELLAIVQYASRNGQYGYFTIPRNYCFLATLDQEGDNYAGQSLLRTSYFHWWAKSMAYRIDLVALDRFGVGIPRAKIKEGVRRDELAAIERMLRGLRSYEKAYIIQPPNVEFDIMIPPSGGHGSSSQLMSTVEHHNGMIAQNILAQFLSMGGQPHGSYGLGKALSDMFLNSLKGVVAGITSAMKHQLVRPLTDMNFDMTGRQYPSVVAMDLAAVDVDQLTTILQKMASTYITPDDGIEQALRKLLGLPKLPDEMLRSKQGGGAGASGGAPAGAEVPGGGGGNIAPPQEPPMPQGDEGMSYPGKVMASPEGKKAAGMVTQLKGAAAAAASAGHSELAGQLGAAADQLHGELSGLGAPYSPDEPVPSA